jgi:transcriptional regulator with XRE-family HTH domain
MDKKDRINETTKRWREVRKSVNMSQPQFAEVLDTTQAAISLIESGRTKNPSVDTINRLFKAFPTLSKTWFFDGTGPMYVTKTKSNVSQILDADDLLDLPDTYKFDPVLKEYLMKIKSVVAMQEDRINKLEQEKEALQKDKDFLQQMIRHRQEVTY